MTVTDWNPLHGTDWDPLLGQEFEKEYWTCLQRCVEQERSCHNVYPRRDEVFAALRLTQCSETKVVIVGQDPYHGAGQAHGLAFSVPRDVSVPRTLRNIYQELQDDLRVGIPDQGSLEPWARRGVLLLNAVFTVREGRRARTGAWGGRSSRTRCSESSTRRHIPCSSSGARMPKEGRRRSSTRPGRGSSSRRTPHRRPPPRASSGASRSAVRTSRSSRQGGRISIGG